MKSCPNCKRGILRKVSLNIGHKVWECDNCLILIDDDNPSLRQTFRLNEELWDECSVS